MTNKSDTDKLRAIQKMVMQELEKADTDFSYINKLNDKRSAIIFRIHKKGTEKLLK